MATFRDWFHLAKSTLLSVEGRQVTGLYGVEWPEAKRRLIADHSDLIDAESSRLRRFVRTNSAILYGLTKRLAPQRRLLFFAAQFTLLMSFVSLFSRDAHNVSFTTYGGLLASFVFITVLLAMELIDKIKYRDELELARQLQSELIPKELPKLDGLELSAFNYIANTVGGDIYDFTPLPDGRLAVLFGDASGHGMAAGLIMAVAHATFRTQLDTDPSPQAMFATLNRILCQTGGSRSFFAGAYLLISKDGSYEAVIAGHPPILQFSSAGEPKGSVGSGSYPLGVKRNYLWQTEYGTLDAGDFLILHSDGLVESRDEVGAEFGDDRVLFMSRLAAGRAARDVVNGLVSHWTTFCGRVQPDDDVSIAVIRRV
jgi:hypothetical protein